MAETKKVVLITGGSSGIGKSIGDFLFQKGYHVFGTSRNPEAILDSKFPLLKVDVSDFESISTAVATIIDQYGRLDIVINNAGVGITGPLEEIPLEAIKNNFETNFYGPISVIKAVLPQMRVQKSGLIINITSIAAYIGLPYRSVYSASKAALQIITESLRLEVQPFGIQITNVAPGDFETNIAANRFHAPIIKNSPYVAYQKILDLMNLHVKTGANPDLMAAAIFKIIQNPKPKIHYKVGAFMEKFSIVLKRVLPDKIYEKMLQNHFKL